MKAESRADIILIMFNIMVCITLSMIGFYMGLPLVMRLLVLSLCIPIAMLFGSQLGKMSGAAQGEGMIKGFNAAKAMQAGRSLEDIDKVLQGDE